jgi:hypothetical protein
MIQELVEGIIMILALVGLVVCIRIIADWIVNKLG